MKTFKELFIERCEKEPDYPGNKKAAEDITNDEFFQVFVELAEQYKDQYVTKLADESIKQSGS